MNIANQKYSCLNQPLMPDPECGDYVCADFLNLGVVDDTNFNIKVKHLTEEQAKIALGICIKEILSTRRKIKKLSNLVYEL